jgi:hypothetical protein
VLGVRVHARTSRGMSKYLLQVSAAYSVLFHMNSHCSIDAAMPRADRYTLFSLDRAGAGKHVTQVMSNNNVTCEPASERFSRYFLRTKTGPSLLFVRQLDERFFSPANAIALFASSSIRLQYTSVPRARALN